MFTVVTGASQNHYNTLIEMIKSFTLHCNGFDCKLIVYNLGINYDKWNKLQLLFNNNQNIFYEIFDYSLYPDYFNINVNAGEYAWKPIIFYDTCEKYGNIVIWMDSGNLIEDSIKKLLDALYVDYIHTGLTSGDILKWTHIKTLEYMKCNPKFLNYQNRNGACVAVNYRHDWVKEFVKEWKNLALIKECIAPDGSSRQNHRQDQAVLTILYYKYKELYNFKSFDNEHWKYFLGYSIHNDVDKDKEEIIPNTTPLNEVQKEMPRMPPAAIRQYKLSFLNLRK